jgi:AcrR family transcriptional regulator
MTASRPYVQVARAEARDRTSEALLDAAEEAFFSVGWERVSLHEIAADAGVTKQTLLRHFRSKDGLFEQAWARAYERVREQRMSAPADDIEGAVDNLLDHYEAMGERALMLAAMDGDERVAEVGQRGREFHYEWVEHAFGSWLSAVRGRARSRRRAALIALCDVHTWWLLSHDLELPRPEVRATLAHAIRRLLEDDS